MYSRRYASLILALLSCLLLAGRVPLPAQTATLTPLHYFANRPDGALPVSSLIQGSDGNFYGTTEDGGLYGNGMVFEITPGGTITPLHSFTGTDGASPEAALILASDGNFYG